MGPLTRLAKLLAGVPRDTAGGIKVLSADSDKLFDTLMAGGRTTMGDNLFFGGPRNVAPEKGRQAFLATNPAHAMYYASLPKEGALSVYRGNLGRLPIIDNNAADTDRLIETLLGYTDAKLAKPSTWSNLSAFEKQMLEQINDVGGAKLLNVDDYALTPSMHGFYEDEHLAPQYLVLPKALKTLEKRAKGGLIEYTRGE